MVSLYAPSWSARKRDAKITAEVKAEHNVEPDVEAGNFNKMLLPEFPELKACQSYIAKTRQELYLRSAPWGEQRGNRSILPEDTIDLRAWFSDRVAGFEPIKQAMLDKYDEQVALTEFKLNGMYDPEDYPTKERVSEKFKLKLSILPMPNVNDIRLLTDVPQHIRDEIAEAVTDELNANLNATLSYGMQALYKPIAHMATILKKYKDGEVKKLYDSVVENVRTMSDMAHKLNLTRNPVLEQLAIEAANLVDELTTKDLKESEGLQATTAKKAQALADRIAKLMP
jgi:hypothetical protein